MLRFVHLTKCLTSRPETFYGSESSRLFYYFTLIVSEDSRDIFVMSVMVSFCFLKLNLTLQETSARHCLLSIYPFCTLAPAHPKVLCDILEFLFLNGFFPGNFNSDIAMSATDLTHLFSNLKPFFYLTVLIQFGIYDLGRRGYLLRWQIS